MDRKEQIQKMLDVLAALPAIPTPQQFDAVVNNVDLGDATPLERALVAEVAVEIDCHDAERRVRERLAAWQPDHRAN